MSKILTTKAMNKKKTIIACVVGVCVVASIVINEWQVYVALIVIVLLAILNLYVFNKNRFWARNINNLKVIGRNYDTLIIGETIETSSLGINTGKCISVTCPGRSEEASEILAYRLFSLLKDGGTLVITFHRKESEKISSLDIPYIHDVTLLEMGINIRKKYFPLLLNPIQSLKVALGAKSHHATTAESNKELSAFCDSRQIKLLTFQV